MVYCIAGYSMLKSRQNAISLSLDTAVQRAYVQTAIHGAGGYIHGGYIHGGVYCVCGGVTVIVSSIIHVYECILYTLTGLSLGGFSLRNHTANWSSLIPVTVYAYTYTDIIH